MKRIFALIVAIVMVWSMVACSPQDGTEGTAGDDKKQYNAILITDAGKLGDQSFNDCAWEGFQRAEEELDVTVSCLESESAEAYDENLKQAIERGADLIVCAGAQMADAVKAAASKYPDQRIAIIDVDYIENANVSCLSFNEEEGSFLAGVAAAMTSKSGTIGFVGGVKLVNVERFQYGYEAGARAINPDIQVVCTYTQSFTDIEKGKKAALEQHEQGADVIYQAAGGCGEGVIAAAEELGFWAIGSDLDQSGMAPQNVLCSMIKRTDNAAYMVIKQVKEGSFNGGNHTFSLAEGGVGISDNAGNLTAEVREAVDMWSEAIVNGAFEVPYTAESLKEFKAPVLK